MDKIFDLIKREPVMAASVVQSTLTLAVSFGLGLTADQIGSILAFTNTITALIARAYVTPNHVVAEKVEVALNTPIPPHKDGGPMDLLQQPGSSQIDPDEKP